MTDQILKLLILGAHPDDAEFHAGGLAAIYRQRGHQVRMISVTDGGAGHHERPADELRQIRRAEAAAAGNVIGAEYFTWDFPDGSLLPTLEVREKIIREIRSYQPDLVLTHRTSDYHPDHRAVGQVVQDASYMVTVPLVVPDVPFLQRDPVVAYMVDLFTRPCPMQPDIVIDVTCQIDTIVAMLACHQSQFFEFLPFNLNVNQKLPTDPVERKSWLHNWYLTLTAKRSERFLPELIANYGEQRSQQVQLMEAYEISEYAASIDRVTRSKLFPTSELQEDH